MYMLAAHTAPIYISKGWRCAITLQINGGGLIWMVSWHATTRKEICDGSQATGTESQRIGAVAIAPGGDLYVAGFYTKSVQLGHETRGSGNVGRFSGQIPRRDAGATLTSNYPNPFTHVDKSNMLCPHPVKYT